jgi:hypothetical protein
MKKFWSLLLVSIMFSSFVIGQDNPVKWKLSTKKISDCEYELVFNGTIEDHWHVYSLNKLSEDGPMPRECHG